MANRYAVKMLDWRHHEWDFTGNWAAGIKSGGIEGMVGSMLDTVAQPLGHSGQMVLSQQAQPMTGQVTFHCRADRDRTADEVAADFRRAFSGHLSRKNLLTVNSPLGNVSAPVRLNGFIASPVEDPSWDEIVLNVQVPLIADEGVWWMSLTVLKGKAVVTNFGDVPVWVAIRWSGSGGRVTMPSGGSFVLPAVPTERVLYLSRQDSLVVTDKDGKRDDATWKKVRGATPEMVPVGEQRTFKLPAGAQLEYQIGVYDPWQ